MVDVEEEIDAEAEEEVLEEGGEGEEEDEELGLACDKQKSGQLINLLRATFIKTITKQHSYLCFPIRRCGCCDR